jgi:7-cyano-7-deazaguanine synthase
MTAAVVLLSGGLDSAVALYWARGQGFRLHALEIEYHRRPPRERACSEALARATDAERLVVHLPFLREAEDQPADRRPAALSGAPRGYLPARNLVFYSIAAHCAESLGASIIVGGHNRPDGERFPDARRGFFDALERLFADGLWSARERPLRVALPLAAMDKTAALRLGLDLGVPFAQTWSCYEDDAERPCGRCPSCVERARAFEAVGLSDPLL